MKLPVLLRHAPALVGVVLLFAAIYAAQRVFRHLRLDDIGHALEAIPPWALGLSFAFTVLSYAVLTIYDRLGTIYAGHKVPYGRVAFASFCAYALSHNLGFSAVSGAAVRYRLYAHWGLTPVQIAKTVAFCSLTFGLGGMVLGGAILFIEPRSVPFFGDHLPRWLLYAAAALLWAIVAGYVILARLFGTVRVFGHVTELPGWRMAIVQVALATADVAITASIFWVLLPHAQHLTWLVFLGVYVGSYTAGLAASLPGGLGVFDSVLLFGLAPFLPAPRIVAAIVVFRLYYYVIPLFLAGCLFAANEMVLRGGGLLGRIGRISGVAAIGRWSEPDLAVAASTGAVTLSGMLLLGVGLLSPRYPDLSWADPDLADFAVRAGQFVPSLIGAGLVVLVIGLIHRVNLAWGLTLLLLVGGAAFILAEREHVWIAAVLVLSATVLMPFRGCFYRHARLLSGPLDPSTTISLLALVVCVLALAGFRRRVHGVPNNAWWEIILSDQMPWGLRASVGLTVALALFAVWFLVRPCRVSWRRWDAAERERLARLGMRPPPGVEGVVWGESERAAIGFRRVGRVLLALGDPAGAAGDRISAIWRMRDLARQEGLDPAVWAAGPELLNVYSDLGLAALPLGPDGLPLPEAPDETPPASQYLVCMAERDLGLLLPLLPELAGRAAALG
ncbi:MAG TPA: lysylphosphatidylglycerol synthase domain-containing protein [Acetobacteraceae bacterium]